MCVQVWGLFPAGVMVARRGRGQTTVGVANSRTDSLSLRRKTAGDTTVERRWTVPPARGQDGYPEVTMTTSHSIRSAITETSFT